MPCIHVYIFPRKEEEYSQIAEAFTEDLEKICNIPKKNTHIIFFDLPRERWSWGGALYSQRRLLPNGEWTEPEK
jgi:phenylpyruvate tautomerase PptA (4-oxalocrotonate tautomerase family)